MAYKITFCVVVYEMRLNERSRGMLDMQPQQIVGYRVSRLKDNSMRRVVVLDLNPDIIQPPVRKDVVQ